MLGFLEPPRLLGQLSKGATDGCNPENSAKHEVKEPLIEYFLPRHCPLHCFAFSYNLFCFSKAVRVLGGRLPSSAAALHRAAGLPAWLGAESAGGSVKVCEVKQLKVYVRQAQEFRFCVFTAPHSLRQVLRRGVWRRGPPPLRLVL